MARRVMSERRAFGAPGPALCLCWGAPTVPLAPHCPAIGALCRVTCQASEDAALAACRVGATGVRRSRPCALLVLGSAYRPARSSLPCHWCALSRWALCCRGCYDSGPARGPRCGPSPSRQVSCVAAIRCRFCCRSRWPRPRFALPGPGSLRAFLRVKKRARVRLPERGRLAAWVCPK